MSRITRNSYRPRASIEPWLTLSRHLLVALAHSTAPLHQRRLIQMDTSQTAPGKLNDRGLDLEKASRLRSTQNFFLDIPFYRTHRPPFSPPCGELPAAAYFPVPWSCSCTRGICDDTCSSNIIAMRRSNWKKVVVFLPSRTLATIGT